MDIGNWLQVDLGVPLSNSVSSILRPTRVHLYLVELDGAYLDILWASEVDLGLHRHIEEGLIVDEQNEFVIRQVIE